MNSLRNLGVLILAFASIASSARADNDVPFLNYNFITLVPKGVCNGPVHDPEYFCDGDSLEYKDGSSFLSVYLLPNDKFQVRISLLLAKDERVEFSGEGSAKMSKEEPPSSVTAVDANGCKIGITFATYHWLQVDPINKKCDSRLEIDAPSGGLLYGGIAHQAP